MKPQIADINYLSQSAILFRIGWSRTLIANLLGEPDARKKVFGRTNPTCLYLSERVIAAEASEAFALAQDKLAKRRAAATIAVKTKTDDLMAAVESMQINVRVLEASTLQKLAIRAYNDFSRNENFASHDDDPLFLERIKVNFIRHELTQYDHALERTAGKTGKQKAVSAIRARVYAAIASAYPGYREECARQHKRREDQQSELGNDQ